MHGACLRDAQKLIETRVRLVPAFLSLFRQRKSAKKTTPAATPSAFGYGCPALLENRGRHETCVGCAAASDNRGGKPPGFLRCSAGFMGAPNPARRGGLCVLTGFGADLTSLPTISLTPIPTYIASLTKPSAAVLARRTTADSTGKYGKVVQQRQEGFVSRS